MEELSDSQLKRDWQLRGIQGQLSGETFPLTEENIWMGRDSRVRSTPAHLLFDDKFVSRDHSVLAWSADHDCYFLFHRSKTNATLLNGQIVKEPKQLKPGDQISLGQQVLVYEPAGQLLEEADEDAMVVLEGSDSLGQDEAEPGEYDLHVGIRGPYQICFVGSASRWLRLSFSPAQSELTGPFRDGDSTTYHLPSVEEFSVVIELEEISGDVTAKVEGAAPSIERFCSLGSITLQQPLCSDEGHLFHRRDRFSVGPYSLWILAEAQDPVPEVSSADEHGQAFKKRGVLDFRAGTWQGTEVTMLAIDDNSLELGPDGKIGAHPLAIESAPLCRIKFFEDRPYIEVVEADDGQYLSLNGELLFKGQLNPLVTGSSLFLGEHMMYWNQPTIQAQLEDHQLATRETVFPITSAFVRLGTGAHCEVLISGNGLESETGILEFGDQGFVYHHLDTNYPAQIDGQMVMGGEQAEVKVGTVLQLGLECSLTLEKRS